MMSNDPEWRIFSNKLQIKLTKDIIQLLIWTLTIGYMFSAKSFVNITVVICSATLLFIFTHDKTFSIMNWMILIIIVLVPWLRLFLVGRETLLYNQIYTSIAILPVMIFARSFIINGIAFIYILIFVYLNGNLIIKEYINSPIDFEKTLSYFMGHCHVICLMIFAYAMLLAYKHQVMIAQLWTKQKETEALLSQLAKQNEMLKELNQSKNNLLLSFSHEFRNPINAALGNLELAQDKITNLAIKKYLVDCKVSIEILFHLVSNLLDSTKLESGALEMSPLVKSSQTIFYKLWDLVKNLLDKQGLVGEFYIDRKIPRLLNVDSHFLIKILLNLVLNSLKYTNQGGIMIVATWLNETFITENMLVPSQGFLSRFTTDNHKRLNCLLSWQRSDQKLKKDFELLRPQLHQPEPSKYEIPAENEYNIERRLNKHRLIRPNSIEDIQNFQNLYKQYQKLTNKDILSPLHMHQDTKNNEVEIKKKGLLKLEVFDSGCGISPEIKGTLFKKFSSSLKKSGDRLGAGLGLWLTKNLCELMSGQIRAFSEKNEGSQFVAVFPVESAESEDHSQKSQVVKIIPNITALVVDDDKYNREIHTAFLKKAGVIVKDEAADGQEAVELFISKPANYYDLIMMDLEMPVMNGKEALKKIRLFEEVNQRSPSMIMIATGNCDLSEYSLCMDKQGNIKADAFYRKPMFQKDVEEFAQEILRKKMMQSTCMMIGGDVMTIEFLETFLKRFRISLIQVPKIQQAANFLNDYASTLRWILIDIDMNFEGIKEYLEKVRDPLLMIRAIEVIGFSKDITIEKKLLWRQVGVERILKKPLEQNEINDIFCH